MKAPTIKQPTPPAAEIPAEILATSIEQIAKGMKILNGTRLNRKALVLLIHDASKVSRRDVDLVLIHLESLEQIWLKK